MADADLFVMPSESENFGMSAVESMAAGLPILVSDNVPVGALAKQAFAGETAVCNAIAFSNAAVELLGNPEKLRKMGHNGKVATSKLFDHEVVAKDMRSHLERIVAETNKKNDRSN
jgi:glycosyltransferase involved in cell wall biosynthesis